MEIENTLAKNITAAGDFDIKMTKELESEVSVMCNLSKGIEEKGMKEGILASIQNLMESMGWSVEQAMKALKIPESERSAYADNLMSMMQRNEEYNQKSMDTL